MNPPNYNLNKPPNGIYPGFPPSSLQIPADRLSMNPVNHQQLPYGTVSLDDAVKKNEYNLNLYWRGYPFPSPNMRLAQQPRFDYRGLEFLERSHPGFDRHLAYSNPNYCRMMPPPPPMDYQGLVNPGYPSERQLLEFEMLRQRAYSQRMDPPVIPMSAEPKRRDRAPEVIVLEDSDDSVQAIPPPPVEVPPPPAPEKKPLIQPSKPTAVIVAPVVTKKTRQNKDKPLVKKASAAIKPSQPAVTAVKRTFRPVATKPPIVDEEPTVVNRNLKIKIKKISKTLKSEPAKIRERERPVREPRLAAQEKNLPNYGDTHGKIKSGINYQAEISDFLANDTEFIEQRQQKLGQLGERMRWDSKTNYASYKMIREKYPNIQAGKIINFLVSCKNAEVTLDGFGSYLEQSKEEHKIQQEIQECQKDEQLTSNENGRITRQNIKNKVGVL